MVVPNELASALRLGNCYNARDKHFFFALTIITARFFGVVNSLFLAENDLIM
jgi:hypothetical protein